MKWRILKSGKLSPAENMAIDEAIMQAVIAGKSLPTIRFYDWNPSTASCGYNQSAEKEVDFRALEKYGYGFVRRPTGGRLVLHDQEVTYSVIAPIDGRFSGSITNAYSIISLALAEGLKEMGIEVELERGNLTSAHQREEANPCFTSSSKFELKCNRKKIVGSAQVRKDNILLQHGSILLNNDQSKIAYLLPNLEEDQRNKLAHYLSRKTIAINQVLEIPISYNDAVICLENGFRKSWDTDIFSKHNKLTQYEIETSSRLVHSKYLTDEWNKRN